MKYLMSIVCLLLGSSFVFAQIGVDNTDPDPSSILDLNSTEKGLLIPRMTSAQRQAIISPANSLLVFDITVNKYLYYYSGQWRSFNYWSPTGSGADIYYNSGNVGVGGTPTTKFYVLGNGNTVADRAWLQFTSPSVAMYLQQDGTGDLLELHSTATSKSVVVANSGNVGIGITLPHAPLQFASGVAYRKIVLNEDANNDHQVNAFGVVSGGHTRYQTPAPTSDHVFYSGTSATTSNELMRIKGNGLVNIGSSTQDGTLSVARGNGTQGTAVFQGTTYNTLFNYQTGEDTYLRGGKNGSKVYINDASNGDVLIAGGGGKVGIGGDPGAFPFKVIAASAIIGLETTGTGEVVYELKRTGSTPAQWQVYIPTGGTNLQFWNSVSSTVFTYTLSGIGTGTDWVATSDQRLKYNIVPVGTQLNKIKDIAKLVGNYDRTDTKKNETGFVAQELLEVAPEYVNVPDDSAQMMSVNYSKMVVPLYKAVAELSAKVEALEKENERLKKLLQK